MKTTLIAAACAAALLAPLQAGAQAYPSKTIRFVVGFPAGSTIDNVSRVVLDDIRTRTSATIVVENKPGALGAIGGEQVVKSAADGYMLMANSSATNSSGPHLFKRSPYDAIKDFTHLARTVRFDVIVVTSAAQPYPNMRALVDAAKAKPKALNFGYGSGTGQVVAAAFARAAGMDVVGVPYKGQPAAITDLMGGQVNFVASDLGAVLSHIRSGKLNAIAVASDKRSTILAGVPTTREQGLRDVELPGWIGVAGPAALPAEVVGWWNRQLGLSLAAPEVVERLKNMGMEPDLLTGEPLQRFVQEQYASWGRHVREAGIQAE